MLKYFVCIFSIWLLAAGCEKAVQPVLINNELIQITDSNSFQLINSKGEPVLMVAGQEITSDEIINEPANLGDLFISPFEHLKPIAQGLEIGEFKERTGDLLNIIVADKVTEILLYKSAKKQFGDSLDENLDKAAESEIRRFTQQFGGDQAKADEAIKNAWHDRESYKKFLKREILTQWYLSSQQAINSSISLRQLKKQYEKMKNESFAITPMIEFRLIDIVPAKLEIADPNQDCNNYAEKLADEIFTRLKSGEDFAELAKQYSQGPKKQFGGSWAAVNPDSLAEPYDSIAKASQDMKPGDISKPIKAGTHIFIVKLENKREAGYVPFEEVQEQVRQAALQEQNKNAALNKLKESIDQQMKLDETKAFIDFCLEKIYKESNQGEK
jgi:parvulin-like peptidyl-prolyl isomerase